MNMNSLNSYPQTFKRNNPNSTTFHTKFLSASRAVHPSSPLPIFQQGRLNFSAFDDELASTVVPSVTVVLEGRSIAQRICLHKHASYQSLARELRQMFVDDAGVPFDADLNLSNAIPGHLIAYEDLEDDLLLAGDLNWKDFVRVAKRIRILPTKAHPRRFHFGP